MKTFKQLISEVEEPRGGDERRFKQLHVDAIEVVDYPIPGNEHVFKGTFQAMPRLGDITQPDAENYDQTYKDHGDEGVVSRFDDEDDEEDDEEEDGVEERVSKLRLQSMMDESSDTRMGTITVKTDAEREARAKAYRDKNDKEGPVRIKLRSKMSSNMGSSVARGALMQREETIIEAVERLNELSPNTLHHYIKKAAGNMAGNAAVAATQASSSMGKASADVKRKIRNRMNGITGASGRLADKANMSEETIIEAVRPGTIKLDDGSTQKITKEDADVLNSLFTQLNSANRAKMESRLTSSKKGFTEILEFAKNI